MSDLLNNPAVQSGVIPLVVALIVALLLKPLGGSWNGLAFGIAYYLSVFLTVGFQFFPLTSTRKILLVGIVALILGLIFDSGKLKIKNLPVIVSVVGAIAALWVIWPVLVRQEGLSLLLMSIPALLYTGWLAAGCQKLQDSPDRGAMLVLALGLGTGISSILGASALTGQLGIAIGAIAGAYLLLSLFKQNVNPGSTFMLPAGLLSGLLGVGAVIYASLPWYCLIPLAAAPLTMYIQLPEQLEKLKSLLLLATITLPFTAIAIGLTWISTSSSESMY